MIPGFAKPTGLPGEFKVYGARGERTATMASWYVESPEAGRAMVARWRDSEPDEYPLDGEWVTIYKGEEVDRFTTRETKS